MSVFAGYDPLFLALAVVAAILVGLGKGGVNMVGTLAVPLMSLTISPVKAAALLLPIYVISDVFGVWAYRRSWSLKYFLVLAPSALLGIGIGWATAAVTSERMVTFALGIICIGYCINAWRRRHAQTVAQPFSLPKGIFWGAVAGFTSFVSNSGAPPYQIYMVPQRLEKTLFAGTTAVFFAFMNWMKLVPYWALGQISIGNLKVALCLMPFAIASTFIGVRLVRVIPQKRFYQFIEVMMVVISVKLISDAIRG